jgi:hypothetical protein
VVLTHFGARPGGTVVRTPSVTESLIRVPLSKPATVQACHRARHRAASTKPSLWQQQNQLNDTVLGLRQHFDPQVVEIRDAVRLRPQASLSSVFKRLVTCLEQDLSVEPHL